MSAWIVNKVHIDALVTALVAWEFILPERATETGRMLWLENVKSIHARYPDTEANDSGYPGPIDFTKADAEEYEFTALPGLVDPQIVDKACDSYRYQTCEHGGWRASRSQELTAQLIDHAAKSVAEFAQRYGPLEPVELGSHAYSWDVSFGDLFQAAAALRAEHRAQVPA